MNSKTIKLILLFFVLSSLLFAQGAPKLELMILDTKVNMTQSEKEGRTQISYKPGDIIRYTIIASNVGNAVLTNPLITDPIPKGVSYNPYSAKGLNSVITYSVNDGRLFQSWPPKYSVKDENGQTVVKLASPDMVTHVRWELTKTLTPNESHQLEFEVIVK
ncbi:MAG: DUF11 domain-containing protein, partial [Candidatus Marinimicrobia bacterium]|nr:DUF11 domain-containing protein [Candidatus Neomarinimicrobiota bacterium]